MTVAKAVEHLQLLQPRQSAQAATLRLFNYDDLLEIGIHG